MKTVLLLLGLISLSTSALAAPITFTGAELATLNGASLPTGQERIIGNSLRFDPVPGFSVLYRLSLDGFTVDPNGVGVSVDLTRLLRDDGIADQDIYIGLYDGQNFLNTFFVDTTNTDYAAQNRLDTLAIDETTIALGSILGTGAFTSSPIGSVAQLDVFIRALPSGTEIIGNVNQAASVSSTTATRLDFDRGLSLIIAADNEPGEVYQIDALTFTSGVSFPTAVPEPGALGGMAFGLLALGLGRYRRRGECAV